MWIYKITNIQNNKIYIGQTLRNSISFIISFFDWIIIFNPILGIPFLITPIVTVSMAYIAQKIGLISMGYIVDPSFAPFFIQGYLSSLDFRNLIFYFLLVVISLIIYFPFFKVYEKNLIAQEQE